MEKTPKTHITTSAPTAPRSPISDLSIPLRWRDDCLPGVLDGEVLTPERAIAWIEGIIQQMGGISRCMIPTPEEERLIKEQEERMKRLFPF